MVKFRIMKLIAKILVAFVFQKLLYVFYVVEFYIYRICLYKRSTTSISKYYVDSYI